uniref:Receptor protein-tyrosine kinase n=1 Tax=Takifugu rubripes TaxID=31033 RepID=A0A674NXZ7_TAKRU
MTAVRKVQQVLLCVLLPCALCRAQTQQVVCSGTQNGLSTTGTSEIQYNLTKKIYTNCEIVMGNLEITMMEHSRDFSFLQSIREVTGYILLAINEFSRLPLDNLRVIRGNVLYENQYALAIMINYRKDGEHGLQELGLTHLTEILQGGVKIIKNRDLSYAPKVNWLDIVKDGAANITIFGNGPEKPCHEACGDVPCWGPGRNMCQIMTKTVCAPQCNFRCFGRSPSECCHSECAGGCTGPLDTDCFACRRFNDSGSCVPQCPMALIYNKYTFRLEPNPNAKFQYGSICVAQCPPNFLVDGTSCVSSCPADKTEVEKKGVKRCEPCEGLCPKACHGTGSGTRETVDALNIDSFINCTKIQGSLHFLVTGIEGDKYKNVPPLDPEKLKIFNTVRQITDILSVQSWPTNMSDLSVFSNLQIIEGRKLYNSYSLLVVKNPSLTSLGLRSLREINDGAVYITGNKRLCYHDTVNWTRFSGVVPVGGDITLNVPTVREGLMCDPLCSSDGCWGPGPNQCMSCKKYSRGGICVPDCMFLDGERREFATVSGECKPCHPECKVQKGRETCKGLGADECVECANLQDGPHCISSCPQGVMGGEEIIFKYPNKQGRCEPCHANCTKGCYGPGIGDCFLSCFEIIFSFLVIRQMVTGIVVGVIALLFVSFAVFVLTVLYRRGLAIRRKRAMRRYMERGESFEPLDHGEKGTKVHARILKPSELRTVKLLGNGVFGSVYKGIWIPEGETVKLPVAIKVIHDRTGQKTFNKPTDHMIVLGSLDHMNIVRILGICPGDSLQLISQLSSHGSLLEHVRNCKNKLSPQRLLNWCVQIAKGMYYLEENKVVHRNLAARNVLLKNNYTAQVSDYGIADLLHRDDKKYFFNEAKAPIKWMALESILFRKYTHQSDVWSYGVTVWEMMSYGAEPYNTMRPQDVSDLLEKGERLSQPQICTIDVYMVMVKCWMVDENVRPTFKELANEFTRMARDPPRYLVIKDTDEHVQRSADVLDADDLDVLEVVDTEMMNQEKEDEECGLAPAPYYVPQNRTLSRLSKMDTYKTVWASRSRLNSGRTMSESSEGCGTVVDMERSEDVSLSGSLKRHRNRQDSAYMSQRDSMSCGPPETPSPDMEEEDQNGYTMSSYNSDLEQPGSNDVKYEYMDIRSIDKEDSPPAQAPPLPPLLVKAMVDQEVEELEDEEVDGYVEDSIYHYTNQQPKLRQVLQQMKAVKIEGKDNGQLYEYEDMDSITSAQPEDAAVYQNIQKEGDSAARQGPAQTPGFDAYVRVRAGVGLGEPAAVDRSFDNPNYWHSRMFLKPNAVPT